MLQNNKDYMDQSLDEIKLLKYVNEHDPGDEQGILQLYDYFYYKVLPLSVSSGIWPSRLKSASVQALHWLFEMLPTPYQQVCI